MTEILKKKLKILNFSYQIYNKKTFIKKDINLKHTI